MPSTARDTRPTAPDFGEWYADYVREAPAGDIVATLERQAGALADQFLAFSDDAARFRYAPGKWSVKEIILHLADAERVFSYRAVSFARGDAGPLPGFDENAWTPASRADARSVADLVAEFRAARASTVALFRGLDGAQWEGRGAASGNPFTVRALAWIIAGHAAHHARVVAERYRP